MRQVKLPFGGRCLCGAVQYRVTEPPIMFYACHCTDCQKRSGSAFNLSMWVKRASIEVAQGEPARVELQSTLDDTKQSEPVGHIWVRSAQPWVKIPKDEWSFETQPENFAVLAEAWRSRHPGS